MKRIEAISALALILVLACGPVATLGSYTSDTGSSVELNISAPVYSSFSLTREDWSKIGVDETTQTILIPNAFQDADGSWYQIREISDDAFIDHYAVNSLIIESGVTNIGYRAFGGCYALESVKLPNTLQKIDASAFSYCENIKTISIPNSVTEIGKAAFYQNSQLTSITIGSNVARIGDRCFFNCHALQSISLPEKLTRIEEYTFHAAGIQSIYIPASVTSIDIGAFIYCNNLTDVYYGGTAEQWAAINIAAQNESLTGATIHYGA